MTKTQNPNIVSKELPSSLQKIADRIPVLEARSHIVDMTRSFFKHLGYLEVDTPALVKVPGEEVHLEPVAALLKYSTGEIEKHFLHTSPEFAMKRLVAVTAKPLFQVTKVWRNGESSSTHLQEFLMLEWYHPYTSMEGLMDETEHFVRKILSEYKASFDVQSPFERLTMEDAFRKYTGAELLQCLDDPDKLANSAHMQRRADETWEDLFHRILLEKIEPYIGRDKPTFLTHWPSSQAALARRDPDDSRVALRFELYAQGLELANGFDELRDPDEQRTRFLEDAKQRKKLYPQNDWSIDEDLLEALPYMPPCSGIALGMDRLIMLALNVPHIKEVQWI